MMKKAGLYGATGALVSMLTLSGCDLVLNGEITSENQESADVQNIDDVAGAASATVGARTLPEDVVARVNGSDVLASKGMKNLDDVIVMELLAQKALKGEVDTETLDTIQADIEHLNRQMLMEAYVSDFLDGVSVSDEDVQSYYDNWAEGQDLTQFNFTFARFDQREKAQDAIADIQENDSPDLSAFNHFKEAKSNQDLEWASLDQLPPMFASILPTLDEQGTHDAPLPSNQGYFVIHLEDTRERELPKVGEVSSEIKQALKREALQEHIRGTREEAIIQIK